MKSLSAAAFLCVVSSPSAQIGWVPVAPWVGRTTAAPSLLRDTTNGRFLAVSDSLSVYEWAGNSWSLLYQGNAAPGRSGLRTSYDPIRQVVVLASIDPNQGTWVIEEWGANGWSTPLQSVIGSFLMTSYDSALQATIIVGWSQLTGWGTYMWDGQTLATVNQGPFQYRPWNNHLAVEPTSGSAILVNYDDNSFVLGVARLSISGWTPLPSPPLNYNPVSVLSDPFTGTIAVGGSVTNSSVGHTEGVVQLWDGTAWAVKRAANVPGPYTSAASESGPEILGFDGGAQQTVSGSREVSTVTPFGTGCPGPNGIPTLAVSPASWVQAPIADGNYFVLEWSGISPSPLAWPYFILGFDRVVWSGTLLPYDLGAIGMPGCMLNESIDWLSWYTNFSPTSLGIPIPGYPNLIGLHFFVQVAGFELLGPNGPYVSMTPSLDCKIGVGY